MTKRNGTVKKKRNLERQETIITLRDVKGSRSKNRLRERKVRNTQTKET
jgi:hypothetical protein